jgi:hypothetical protein
VAERGAGVAPEVIGRIIGADKYGTAAATLGFFV